MVIYVVRCIIMILVIWASIRMIGKKSISEMTSYDLAATMVISNIASEPLVYKVTTKATIGTLVVTIVAILINILSLKKFFYNVDSNPIIVISRGKILKRELKKVRMNIPLLISELREKGYQNMSDVEFAIVEPSGKLSVIPKSQSRPVQPSDLSITTSPANLTFPIILDGEILKENLVYAKGDENWLLQQLKSFGINKVEDVLLAEIDSDGYIYVDKKSKDVHQPNIF